MTTPPDHTPIVYYMDQLVQQFFVNFNHHYYRALDTDFTSLSLQQQVAYIKDLYEVGGCGLLQGGAQSKLLVLY